MSQGMPVQQGHSEFRLVWGASKVGLAFGFLGFTAFASFTLAPFQSKVGYS
jgi:hypothetical protein